MDRKNVKSICTLGDEELSTVAGGVFEFGALFSPAVANADKGSQATAFNGNGNAVAPIQNKQTSKIDADIGNSFLPLFLERM